MKLRLEDKNLVLKLRQKGYTYKELMSAIPNLSKSTISGWVKHLELTPKIIKNIEIRSKNAREKGRLKAALILINKRKERDAQLCEIARQEFEKFKKDPLFIFGTALYWAEGSKKTRSFQFANSDPRITKIMLRWIEKYLRIPRKEVRIRLYIHRIYEKENCEDWWERILGISKEKFSKTVYKPTLHQTKKNIQYKGCVRLDITKVAPWIKTMEWQNCFCEDNDV